MIGGVFCFIRMSGGIGDIQVCLVVFMGKVW